MKSPDFVEIDEALDSFALTEVVPEFEGFSARRCDAMVTAEPVKQKRASGIARVEVAMALPARSTKRLFPSSSYFPSHTSSVLRVDRGCG